MPEIDEEMAIASQQYLANEFQADADRWGEMKLEVWETYALWMYDQDLLNQVLDAENAFTNEFLPGGE